MHRSSTSLDTLRQAQQRKLRLMQALCKIKELSSTLANDIEQLIPTELRPFPPMDKTKFRDLLDEEMGFM